MKSTHLYAGKTFKYISRKGENIWGNIGEKLQRKESQSMKISLAGFLIFLKVAKYKSNQKANFDALRFIR